MSEFKFNFKMCISSCSIFLLLSFYIRETLNKCKETYTKMSRVAVFATAKILYKFLKTTNRDRDK